MVKIFNGPGETAPARNGVFPPPFVCARAEGPTQPDPEVTNPAIDL